MLGLAVAACLVAAAPLAGVYAGSPSGAERLLASYPDFLARIDGNTLIWRDGTRMPIDDGKGTKSFNALLEDPDLDDIFAIPYPAGDLSAPPAKDSDPGRARPAAFFDKMYGDCRHGEVSQHLTDVVWLPNKAGQRLRFSKINGAAEQLAAVSKELDQLPERFNAFLLPAAGTYNCRVIAGTTRISTHGHGIAIDIGVKRSHYWRWSKPDANGNYPYENDMPMEIVRVFEKHGFIWGGKWYHYDTMHFEYRPELLPPAP